MGFHEIHSWTLSGLIGAFIDLSLAYCLLCGSVFAFFASKFLKFFGLYLPCPCSGILGFQNSNLCLHRLLTEWPIRKIYFIQKSAEDRFPFDLIRCKDQACNLNVKLVTDRKCESRVLELEGEASCSSFSGPRLQQILDDKESGYDTKGKKIVNQKQRVGIGRRRRGVSGISRSRYVGSGRRIEINESLDPLRGREDGLQDDGGAGTDHDEITSHSFELSGSFCESNSLDKDSPSVKNFISSGQHELGIAGNEVNVIRMLEQALEEEKAASAAIYSELEKERAAAATAADEAMAMILRLQKEKASLEIEAKQYQRMIEEKFVYDEEEMDILKEILFRKEKENHFLEKEVEAYRQMSSDMMNKQGQRPSSPFDSKEDPLQILQQIDNGELEENGNLASEYKSAFVGRQNQNVASEKEVTSLDKVLDSEPSTSPGLVQMLEMDSHILAGKEKDQKDGSVECPGKTIDTDQTSSHIEKKLSCEEENLDKNVEHENQVGSNLHDSILDTEPTVLDIHVIEDETECWKGESEPSIRAALDETRLRDCGLTHGASGVGSCLVLSDLPSTSVEETAHNINGSDLDMGSSIPLLGDPQHKPLLFDSERNSLDAVSCEILKIDTEVEWFRETLRIVQEGKEKLNLSAENREKENVQLKLLEEIANQLQEIQTAKRANAAGRLTPSIF